MLYYLFALSFSTKILKISWLFAPPSRAVRETGYEDDDHRHDAMKQLCEILDPRNNETVGG